jgi:pimeloyl-ACP methyl ester carboxylesterase
VFLIFFTLPLNEPQINSAGLKTGLQSTPLSREQIVSRQDSLSHRYVVFLAGANSFSPGVDSSPLDNRFKYIEDHLRGVGISKFTYFSYGAAARLRVGDLYCSGWGPNACSRTILGDLVSLDLTPIYTQDDTKLPIDLQADALDWFLDQIVQRDPLAKIDLVSYSLGGVIASYWASHAGITSDVKDNVHSIVMIGSPVGGIYMASALLENRFQGIVWAIWLRGWFGQDVLRALQLPEAGGEGSIVASLEEAPRHFSVVSIQSTTDFFVNGRNIKITPVDPLVGTVPIGLGSQYWLVDHVRYHEQNLGGQDIDAVSIGQFKNLIQSNHGAPLKHHQTARWVIDAILGGDLPAYAASVVHQSEYVIVAPGERANLELRLLNTGSLTWEANQAHALLNIGGSTFGLASWQPVPASVSPFNEIEWSLPIVAPQSPGVYYTSWQMAFQDSTTDIVQTFGPEITYVVTVLPEGFSDDLGDTIRQIIDQALQEAKQQFEAFLADLLRQIEERLQEELRRNLPPWAQCLVGPGIVISGVALMAQRKRKSK